MDILLSKLQGVRIPTEPQVVYKDECVYSFDNPETPTGLYVNLNTFLGFGIEYAEKYAQRTGYVVFLHIRRTRNLINGPKINIEIDEAKLQSKITRLTIGLEEGRADPHRYEVKYDYQIVAFLNTVVRIPYPNDKLPPNVIASVEAIKASEPALLKMDTWYDTRKISKHADKLLQLDNGKKIPPQGWICERCELTSNLWLNLTDGSILCGRKYFDGSGGNDHALEHYNEHGYPLAVKLGTISADGKCDVYSYDEDEMVIDTNLEQHLKHFGIEMATMRRSEKRLSELKLELDQKVDEWKLLTECDSELSPIIGPGFTGLRNLGNSCYMNSVMQVLFTVKDFIERYVNDRGAKYFNAFPPDPAHNFNVQMAKLGNGLWSGKYASEEGISPSMFKALVGRDHFEFGSTNQQDGYEFYLHMIGLLERNTFHKETNPTDAFSFLIEDRIECLASGRVKYSYRVEYALPLMIPMEDVETGENLCNKGESCLVPFKACESRLLAPEIIEQFYSSAIEDYTTAKKTTRLFTMPNYLMIHLLKFKMGRDWVPRKLNVAIDMPDKFYAENWRGFGWQQHEKLLPNAKAEATHVLRNNFVYDEIIMAELLSLGFTPEACKRAIFYTNNAGTEAATEWLTQHFADFDINQPFELPAHSGSVHLLSRLPYVPDKESLAQLMNMGFNRVLATKALHATGGDVELATNWIFEHLDDAVMDDEAVIDSKDKIQNLRDGVGEYELVAFISHMGETTQVGHYVCHILKNGQWVIFNDEKVALSQNPPKNHGYLYLYKRVELSN